LLLDSRSGNNQRHLPTKSLLVMRRGILSKKRAAKRMAEDDSDYEDASI